MLLACFNLYKKANKKKRKPCSGSLTPLAWYSEQTKGLLEKLPPVSPHLWQMHRYQKKPSLSSLSTL